jgi:hypothetical protein
VAPERETELVFVDTECTGLRPDDAIWEFAGLRRYRDGSSSWLHILIEHDEMRAATGFANHSGRSTSPAGAHRNSAGPAGEQRSRSRTSSATMRSWSVRSRRLIRCT